MKNPERPPLAPGLYLVATPIGNLGDITLRALRVLRRPIASPAKTRARRRSSSTTYGITTPTISSHQHNEADRTPEFLAAMKKGARIAVVSDAGMPGISDPGMHLAAAAIAAGSCRLAHSRSQRRAERLVASGPEHRALLLCSDFCRRRPARVARLSKKLANRLRGANHRRPLRGPASHSRNARRCRGRLGADVPRRARPRADQAARRVPARQKSPRCAKLAARDRMRGEMVCSIELSREQADSPQTPAPARTHRRTGKIRRSRQKWMRSNASPANAASRKAKCIASSSANAAEDKYSPHSDSAS